MKSYLNLDLRRQCSKKPMKKRAVDKSILAQFSIYELPKNVRKSLVFMGYRN